MRHGRLQGPDKRSGVLWEESAAGLSKASAYLALPLAHGLGHERLFRRPTRGTERGAGRQGQRCKTRLGRDLVSYSSLNLRLLRRGPLHHLRVPRRGVVKVVRDIFVWQSGTEVR